MFGLTEVETNALLNSTDAAVVAATKKLITAEEKGEFVPKSRMNDLSKEVKELTKKLADIDATSKAAEEEKAKQNGEIGKLLEKEKAEKATLTAQLEAEKKDADAHRAFKASTIEKYKTQLGDKWDDSYATLPLEALAKIAGDQIPLLGVVGQRGQPVMKTDLESKLAEAIKANKTLEVISLRRQIAEEKTKK
jgi:hypothetical protein